MMMESAEEIEQDLAPKKYKNTSKSMHFSKKRKRQDSIEEETGCCSIVTDFWSIQYNAMIKSKCLSYLCVSVYIMICLLGNVVMGIIYLKNEPTAEEMNIIENFTENNSSLTNLNLNDSTILDPNFQFDSEILETKDDMNLYMMYLYNVSDNKVSSKFCM